MRDPQQMWNELHAESKRLAEVDELTKRPHLTVNHIKNVVDAMEAVANSKRIVQLPPLTELNEKFTSAMRDCLFLSLAEVINDNKFLRGEFYEDDFRDLRLERAPYLASGGREDYSKIGLPSPYVFYDIDLYKEDPMFNMKIRDAQNGFIVTTFLTEKGYPTEKEFVAADEKDLAKLVEKLAKEAKEPAKK